MSHRHDLSGRTFGHLKVLERSFGGTRAATKVVWLCECECGMTVIARTYELTGGEKTSCGCKRESKKPGPIATSWTPQRVEKLKSLLNEGHSAAHIGLLLGGFDNTPDNGRNAVLGKIHRLGIQRGETHRERAKRAGAKTLRQRKAAEKKNGTERRPSWQISIPASRVLFERSPVVEGPELVIPEAERKRLVDLEDKHCRWPIGDPQKADFHFCARDHVPGLPYCEVHSRRAFAPPESRRYRQPTEPAETVEVATSKDLETVS